MIFIKYPAVHRAVLPHEPRLDLTCYTSSGMMEPHLLLKYSQQRPQYTQLTYMRFDLIIYQPQLLAYIPTPCLHGRSLGRLRLARVALTTCLEGLKEHTCIEEAICIDKTNQHCNFLAHLLFDSWKKVLVCLGVCVCV